MPFNKESITWLYMLGFYLDKIYTPKQEQLRPGPYICKFTNKCAASIQGNLYLPYFVQHHIIFDPVIPNTDCPKGWLFISSSGGYYRLTSFMKFLSHTRDSCSQWDGVYHWNTERNWQLICLFVIALVIPHKTYQTIVSFLTYLFINEKVFLSLLALSS